jgi:hypothetical protein
LDRKIVVHPRNQVQKFFESLGVEMFEDHEIKLFPTRKQFSAEKMDRAVQKNSLK